MKNPIKFMVKRKRGVASHFWPPYAPETNFWIEEWGWPGDPQLEAAVSAIEPSIRGILA
jgi:hypothetical protein